MSTWVESFHTRDDSGEKFSQFLNNLCLYIYRYIFKDSGHSSMPCVSWGTGMLLTKPYLVYLDPY